VVLKPISDLAIATPFGLVWQSDNHSPILRRFIDTTVAAAGGHAVPA
jgi:hypothetical protein